MRIHDAVFFASAFFLFGIFLAGSKLAFLTIVLTAFLLSAIFLLFARFQTAERRNRRVWISGFCLTIIAGALYYGWFNKTEINGINLVFDRPINFEGIVIENPERGNVQKIIVELQPPYAGKIMAKSLPYPAFNYGDKINFRGTIKNPEPENYAEYLAKNGVYGIADSPQSELIAQNQALKIKASLFKLKGKIIGGFEKILAPEPAAFLSGITLGERARFSPGFKEAMNKSGTAHLVALSGYNISVIVIAMFAALNSFLSRRFTIVLTVLAIAGFVIMTGAEASVVRAAIMGLVVLTARQIGRVYSVKNAIVLTALLMALANPKIIYFDVGFQLSFAALLGIVYLSPALKEFLKMKNEDGFLGWRVNFLTTSSAQLAVAPLLIVNFSQFSPVSLLANVLILEVVPITMFLGFLTAVFGFISDGLSLVFGWFAGLFLNYELAVINVFAEINLPITKMNLTGLSIYYATIAAFIFYQNKKRLAQTAG